MLLTPGRSRSKRREIRSVLAFGLGLLVGGLSVAAFLLLVGGLIAHSLDVWWRIGLLSCLTAAAVAEEFGMVGLPRLPTSMIPESRFAPGPTRGAFLFGAELGVGFRTLMPSVVPFVAVAAVLSHSQSIVHPFLVAVGWATGRWLPSLTRLVAVDRSDGRETRGPLSLTAVGTGGAVLACSLYGLLAA